MYHQSLSNQTTKLEQRRIFRETDKALAKSCDFWSFLSKIGNLSYDSDYAYLKYPLQLALNGESLSFCKGSQIGATEAILNYSFYSLVERQRSIFYMLPTDFECADFSSARFNTLVNANETIAKEFDADNVHHKKYRTANLYLRGAGNTKKSKSKIKSVPVSLLVMDELDEISEDTQLQVEERLSGSKSKQEIKISTPTLSDRGIWKEWNKSAQHIYLLKCVHCGHEQQLDFDLTVDLESKSYRCVKCRKAWTHEEKLAMVRNGRWQKICDGNVAGFAISQLYSPTVTASELITKHLEADTDLRKQVFFNHKLGLPFSAEGARLSEDVVALRLGIAKDAGLTRVAGIDVGQGLHHVVVCAWHDVGPIVIDIFRASWQDLPNLLIKHGVQCAVIDANPERSKSREFVQAIGNGWMAIYPSGLKLPYVTLEKEQIVNIQRTEIIDNVLDRFRKDTICINSVLAQHAEFNNFKKHIASVTRLYRESRGNVEAYYTESGADHYLHALCYAEIAGRIGGQVTFDGVSGSFIK